MCIFRAVVVCYCVCAIECTQRPALRQGFRTSQLLQTLIKCCLGWEPFVQSVQKFDFSTKPRLMFRLDCMQCWPRIAQLIEPELLHVVVGQDISKCK